MADKRLDSMNEYEQLKRKNRRRLVGASAMVLVAGIVFGVAVNGGGEGGNAAQNISINKDGGQPEILTPKPIEPAGGKTRQDELENPLLAGGGSAQDEAANDTFEMPSEKAKEVPPVYELKEGQETVEAQGDDGNVHTVVKKAEPNNDYDRQPLPAITINNSNKQAAEKAERKAAQKAAEAKRQAEEKAREIAERKAEADRLAAEEEAAERGKREEEARLAKQNRKPRKNASPKDRLKNKKAGSETARGRKRLKEERLAEQKNVWKSANRPKQKSRRREASGRTENATTTK
ncbi:Tat pathway signal sequence domain protein, partial [Neisseria elongata subsp. glycolytica ATCC 29315]